MNRLLIITHYYPDHLGGIEAIAHELAERLSTRELEITWAANGAAPSRPIENVSYLPLRATNFTERVLGFPYPICGPLSLLRMCRAIRRADIVHLHDSLYLSNVVAAVWSRLTRKSYVVTQHVGLVPYKNFVLRTLMQLANHSIARFVLAGSTQIVFYSHRVQQYFSEFVRFRTQPSFIPNGVRTKRFYPLEFESRVNLRRQLGIPDDKLVMLFVGRFVEKKGLSHLRRLAEQFDQCEWGFVGSGPLDPSMWSLPNVKCWGRLDQPEIVNLYQSADLFVLPSVGEGFPLAVQESMACGTPALISSETASAIPGVEDVCYVSDLDPSTLSATVQRIVDDQLQLTPIRELAARYAMEHWDWDVCTDQYERIFSSLSAR